MHAGDPMDELIYVVRTILDLLSDLEPEYRKMALEKINDCYKEELKNVS